MSNETISVVVRCSDPESDNGAVMLERLLSSWIESRFEPLSLSGLWGGESVERQLPGSDTAWQHLPLWRGESEGSGDFTQVAAPTFAFRNELLRRIPLGDLAITLDGALLHRPTVGSHAQGWYARAKVQPTAHRPGYLVNLAQISFWWGELDRRIALRFPGFGYPVSLAAPPADAESAVRKTSRPEIVAENSRELLRWMAQIPERLGWSLPPEWEINADDAYFDEDVESLREWERRLREGRT